MANGTSNGPTTGPMQVIDPKTGATYQWSAATGTYELVNSAEDQPEVAAQKQVIDTVTQQAGTTVEPVQDTTAAATDLLANANPVGAMAADDNANLMLSQVTTLNMQRLKVAASLMNVFNYAIQVQAGRNNWTEQDYTAFIVCMRAIDQIGANAVDDAKTTKLEQDVRAAIRK